MSTVPAAAQRIAREELRIPMAGAGSGLEALLVRPGQGGRLPLAIISHGSPRDAEARAGMSPNAYLRQATEFARRGFAAVVVMRRGYGGSGGRFVEGIGPCNDPDYLAAIRASAGDLTAAVTHLKQRNDIDGARILAIGHSAGGAATVGLVAAPPAGLVAGISFAGGRGSQTPDEVCREPRLIDAMLTLGQRARLPMLWVYAENDHFFGPRIARRMSEAFKSGGGNLEFVAAPSFGSDGHRLFTAGTPQWTPYVDRFLQKHDLLPRASR